MAIPRLIFLSLACALLVDQSNAQDGRHSVTDAIAEFRAAFPAAVMVSEETSQKLTFVTGLRKSGVRGYPDEVAIGGLRDLGPLFGLSNDHNRFEIVDEKSSRAGGIRYVIEVATDLDPTEKESFILGIHRQPEGSYQYVTADGMVAPPGFVFVVTDDNTGLYEERDDWYVYFVSHFSDSEANPRMAIGEKNNIASAGIELQPSSQNSSTESIQSQVDICQSASFLTVGSGDVYRTNPLRSVPEELSFDNLCDLSPVKLLGRYVRVASETFPSTQDNQGVFHFDPHTPNFDQVNVYYHVNNFIKLMLDRGFSKVIDDGWIVDAILNDSETETIRFDKFDGELLAGNTTHPYRNAVYESAILAHEVVHKLTYDYVSPSLFSIGEKQHWALGESYADYFGLVYRAFQLGHMESWKNPIIGEYLVTEMTRDLPRDLSSDEPTFSGLNRENYVGYDTGDDILNLYDNSVIFSSALVDYDRFDDTEHSSSFVIESLLNLGDSPSFAVGRDALMAATNVCVMVPAPETMFCCESADCQNPVIEAFSLRGMPLTNPAIENDSRASNPVRRSPILSANNYPNPFDLGTTIEFETNRTAIVALRIYNAEGKFVDELVNEHRSAGLHSVVWSPNQLPSGAYFFEINAEGYFRRGSLLFVK